MFVDASAIIAILVEESDGAALARRLEQAAERRTSPIAIYEAVVAIARVCNVSIADAEAVLDRFLEQTTMRVVPITAEIGRRALSAFQRYGRGRHPAALNMGDASPTRVPASSNYLSCSRARIPLTDIAVA